MLRMRCPPAAQYLWGWFKEIAVGRPARLMGGVGPTPIPSAEIAAWADLSGLRPTLWELGVLRKLDMAFIMSGKD